MMNSPGLQIRFFPAFVVTLAATMCMPVCVQSATAQDNDLIVRATTDPELSALVGQRINLKVDVLAQDRWASLPKLPKVDVPGAVIYVPASQSLRLTERIRGESFTGQRYEFWIYPQRKGNLLIPSLNLDVQVKSFGVGSEMKAFEDQTDAIIIDVSYPEGVSDSTGMICADSFSVAQTWDPASGDFQVGDGITRTITRTISGAPGMVLPPLAFPDWDGISVYPKQPEVRDTINRGVLTSRRTESVTYVFEESGKIEIPSVRLRWWDLESGQLRTEELKGLALEILPATGVATEPTVKDTSRREAIPPTLLWAAVTLLIMSAIVFWFRGSIAEYFRHFRKKLESSEPAHFRRFIISARTGDPRKTMQSLVQWWDVADADTRVPRLDRFVDRFGNKQTASLFASLQVAVDSRSKSWQQGEFLNEIRVARKRWLASRRVKATESANCLPPLNPVHPKPIEEG